MLGKATVGLLFLLLVWGNLVAGLKAGLACPDWPLCHGRVLPPFRLDIYMEFLHRVLAAVAGIALLALAHVRFRAYRGGARAVPVLAVLLLAGEVAMGALVVLLELPVQLTTVHFLAGLLLFLLAYYMMAFDGVAAPPAFAAGGYSALFLGMAALLLLLAALGAYVRHVGAGLALPDWPTSLGSLIPSALTGGVLIQFSHRVLSVLVLLTVVALVIATRLDPHLLRYRRHATALLLLLLAQVAVGGLVVLSKLYFLSTGLHLAVALAMLLLLGRMWILEVRDREAPS
ncbi:MAG: hypothetical protein Kow00128_00940 [Deltaproteobacteria bacterium]